MAKSSRTNVTRLTNSKKRQPSVSGHKNPVGGPPARPKSEHIPTRREKQDSFLTAYVQCGTLSGAQRISGVSRHNHQFWKTSDPAYATRFEEAHETAVDNAEEALRKRGIEGVLEPVFYQGEVCGQIRKYSDACLIFYLKGRRGDVFRERTEISGPNGGPVQVEDLSGIPTAQLEQMRQWLIEARERKRLVEARDSAIETESVDAVV